MPMPSEAIENTRKLKKDLREGMMGCVLWTILPFLYMGILIGLSHIVAGFVLR